MFLEDEVENGRNELFLPHDTHAHLQTDVYTFHLVDIDYQANLKLNAPRFFLPTQFYIDKYTLKL